MLKNFQLPLLLEYIPLAPAIIFRGEGGSEVHRGMVCKGVAAWGEASDSREAFKKISKKTMKNLQFIKILKETLRSFQKFLKFYRIFVEHLGKYIENFRDMHF